MGMVCFASLARAMTWKEIMREFFIAQMDYIFFLYGLAFILLAATSYLIFRARRAQAFWRWIALFGIVHGINEWLDMLALSLGDNAPFSMVRIALLTASFLCFVEIARAEARKRLGRILGPWVYAPLLSVTLSAGWMLGGLTGVNILSRYIFGVIGGLLAAGAIMAYPGGQDKKGKDRKLFIFSLLLGSYGATQFFTPKGAFLPASIINQDAFFSLLGFPVQLLRMVLVGILAGLAWREYALEKFSFFSGKWTGSSGMKTVWLPAGLVVILLAGWIMVGSVGQGRDAEEREDLLNSVKIAAATIDPVRIKALSGRLEDLDSEDYKLIQNIFLNIIKVQPRILYTYLFGQKDGKTIFLIDVERPGRRASPLPLAVPGEVYDEDAELLGRIFSSGGAVVVGTPDTATPGPSDDAATPGPSDDASPGVAAAPELEAALPTKVGDVVMTVDSATGSMMLGEDQLSRAITAALRAAGRAPDDLGVAQAYDEAAESDLSILAMAVDGMAGGKVQEFVLETWLSATGAGVTRDTVTLAGAEFTRVNYGDDGPMDYVTTKGDVVFVINTADPALAAEAAAALP